MSYAGFWIQRGQVGVRIGVATSSILTMIAYRFGVGKPAAPAALYDAYGLHFHWLYPARVHGPVWRGSDLGLIRHQSGYHITAKHFDLWARVLFPTAFLALLGWFAAG